MGSILEWDGIRALDTFLPVNQSRLLATTKKDGSVLMEELVVERIQGNCRRESSAFCGLDVEKVFFP